MRGPLNRLKMIKICQINYDASHYRETIYRAIDEEFDSDLYFGIPPKGEIKQMDTTGFKGHVHYTKIYSVGSLFFQSGVLSLIWEPYDIYLGLGETHGISTWLFPILVRLFKPKKKVFFWSHGWYGKESKIQTVVKKVFFRLPNGGTFVYGDYARNLMIKEGLPANKIFVIHNSLAYHKQLELRNMVKPQPLYEEHFGNTNPVLLMIGRLNIRKHMDILFYALSKLNEKGIFYNIVLIGDGEDKEKLMKLSEELSIKKQVWFYGACYDERMNADLIYNSDLCVVPGDVGLTAIHSMMFGTPVISHNHFPFQGPEHEAIRPGLTGDFYDFGSVDSLAETINLWFLNHSDRAAVRSACYREIDTQWTPEFQINVLKEHLK